MPASHFSAGYEESQAISITRRESVVYILNILTLDSNENLSNSCFMKISRDATCTCKTRKHTVCLTRQRLLSEVTYSGLHILSVYLFSGNQTRDLGLASAKIYQFELQKHYTPYISVPTCSMNVIKTKLTGLHKTSMMSNSIY